jgi:sugar phosphate isomerase/epimerase
MHGRCGHAATIKAIMDQVSAKNVGVCWNSNDIDLEDGGVEANFRRVRDRFGDTLHVRELDSEKYPYDVLFRLLAETKYAGWVMIEASSEPADRVAALADQAKLFEQMLRNA